MVSFLIRSICAAMAIAIPATIAQSLDTVPPCLNQCLQKTIQPCTTSSLPALISCINDQCPSNLNTDTTASNLALTYTPKLQYSCQQSFVPGASEEAPTLEVTGDGNCTTSPYAFQSLFISADSTGGDDSVMSLSKMARQCTMSLFSEEGCLGEQTKLDLGDLQGDRCIFQGGRSARLLCSPLRAPETPSYASILSSLCSSPEGNANSPNGTSSAANTTGSPYGGGSGSGNATSSGEPTAPTQSIEPYTGRASGDQVAKPSLIALVALFAVAVLLL